MTDDEFEAIVESLQDKAFAEALEAFGEKGFQRWRNPRYQGRLADAQGHARLTGGCGDTIEIFLKMQDDLVVDASYITDGCGSSALCGSFTAELAIGRSPEEVFALQGADVLEEIGTFPEKDKHCADLAVETLQEAMNNHMVQQHSKG